MWLRLLAGMGANSIAMLATIGFQLISLPLFLHYWDAATYGKWLMLSAVPAYLSMVDVGMVTAAGNKMTILMGSGDLLNTNRVFQSAQLFVMLICSVVAMLTIPVIIFAPLPWVQNFDQRLALAALCLGVLAAIFGGLLEAIFKSTERYAFGTIMTTVVRINEWLGSMVGLAVFGNFAAVAMGGLLGRLFSTVVIAKVASSGQHSIQWGTAHAQKQDIINMVKPAVAFMAFPLANALSFQGMTLLVGVLFGPVAVAIFNTYRTIARLAVQVTAIFSQALWPEFSRLFGQGGVLAVRSIYRKSMLLGVTQSVLLCLILYFMTPFLLQIWTHGAIVFIPDFMILMLFYAAIGGAWHVPRVFLMSTNLHADLAYWALASGLLCLAFTWLIGNHYELKGAAIAMLISEFLIATVCAVIAHRSLSHQASTKLRVK